MEIKWFSQAHPNGAWMHVFGLQISRRPRPPLSKSLTSTVSFSAKPSYAVPDPLHLWEAASETWKPPKSHRRGPCSHCFPVWEQLQGHHDGKIGDEARGGAPNVFDGPLDVGCTSHCPAHESQRGLCKELKVKKCPPDTQREHQSCFHSLWMAFPLLPPESQSQLITRNIPTVSKSILCFLVNIMAPFPSGFLAPSLYPSNLFPMPPRVSFLNSDLAWKLSCFNFSAHPHCSWHKEILLIIHGKPCQPPLWPSSCHYLCSSHVGRTWPVSLVDQTLSFPDCSCPHPHLTLYLVKISNHPSSAHSSWNPSLTASRSGLGVRPLSSHGMSCDCHMCCRCQEDRAWIYLVFSSDLANVCRMNEWVNATPVPIFLGLKASSFFTHQPTGHWASFGLGAPPGDCPVEVKTSHNFRQPINSFVPSTNTGARHVLGAGTEWEIS